jgi:cyclic beta-1,2-glucan synthetase
MHSTAVAEEPPIRFFDTPHTPMPEVKLLSNGRYHVMLSNAGGGYSRWKELALTRWREDGTCDNRAQFCYLRELGQRAGLVDRPSAHAEASGESTRRSSPRDAPSFAATTCS